MKLVDAGIAGARSLAPHNISWQDLGLAMPWPSLIQLLAPETQPRPIQIAALHTHHLLQSRRNAIISAPTNSGKSLVGLLFLLNAIRAGQRAVLLEPLRALAREKADELLSVLPALSASLGYPLTLTVSTGDYRLDEETLAAPPPNRGELIIATPERLEAIFRNPAYGAWLSSIGALCVDEAHLLSTPHRGPTLEHLITAFLCLDAPPRLALLSATLGDTTRAQEWLAPCDLIQTQGRYPQLQKQIIALDEGEDANTVVLTLAQTILAEPTANLLLFVYQTKSAELLATKLNGILQLGENAALAFHAQLSTSERQRIQHAFRTGHCRCLVTTTALSLGVNLPATHVLIRDNTFPGIGRLNTGELLQMMGRAGRGEQAGQAMVLVRPGDRWSVNELQAALCHEQLADFTSALVQPPATMRQETPANLALIEIVATRVAAHLARQPEGGTTDATIRAFFQRSLGGTAFVAQVPAALQWLMDPLRVLAYQDEQGRYQLTVLGHKATRAIFPLTMASGIAQLIRDLLTIDPADQLLARWQPLDTLLLFSLLHERTPTLRPYSAALVDQVDSWMERSPAHTSLLYTEWLRGNKAHSRAEELFGSLGIAPPPQTKPAKEWAHRTAYGALLNAIILYERGQGTTQEELGRQWRLANLAGIEERWRDDCLWLLSGLTQLLDLRCFFYHLKEACHADKERILTVKRRLRQMARHCYQLQTELKYCSPLGSFLHSLRQSLAQREGAVIGIQSIRQLEQAGINTPLLLATLTVEELTKLGLRRDFAKQVHGYLRRRLL